MKIATWNVNSIKVRLERVIQFLQREDPDFLCLQELKCVEEKFPYEALASVGYQCAVFGQKTYNGVAILSKQKPGRILKGLDHADLDKEARVLSADFGSFRLICIYVPNGQEVGSEKYLYKLSWMKALEKYLAQSLKAFPQQVLCGDFNIAQSDLDIYDPEPWREGILFSEKEKIALKKVLDLGFVDLYRSLHATQPGFTWWDYRNFSFQKNHGLRIDLVLGTPPIRNTLEEVYVDKLERKGIQPSDHAPVIAVFKKELLTHLN